MSVCKTMLLLIFLDDLFFLKQVFVLLFVTTNLTSTLFSCLTTRFPNDEALANELAGYFYLEIGQKDVSINYFLQAHEKFHDWGAIAKANALYNFTMSSMAVSNPSPTLQSSSPQVQ